MDRRPAVEVFPSWCFRPETRMSRTAWRTVVMLSECPEWVFVSGPTEDAFGVVVERVRQFVESDG